MAETFQKDLGVEQEMLDAIFGPSKEHNVRIVLKDLNRKYVFANQRALADIEKSDVSEIKGREDSDFFDDQTATERRSWDEAIILGKKSQIIGEREVLFLNNGQKLIELISTVIPVFDSDKKMIGILRFSQPIQGTFDDPSESDSLSHFLRRNSADTRLPYYYKIFFPDRPKIRGSVITSPEFVELFGDAKFHSSFRPIIESDRARVFECLDRVQQAPCPASEFVDFAFTAPNGKEELMRAHLSTAPLSEGQRILIAVHEKISDRKYLSDIISSRIINTSHLFVFVKDSEKRFKFMNETLLDALALPLEAIVNKTDRDLGFVAEEITKFHEDDEFVQRDNSPVFNFEVLTIRKEPFRLLTIKIPIPALFVGSSDGSQMGNINILGISVPLKSRELEKKYLDYFRRE